MNLSLIRHGKTPGNLRGAFVGSIDQPIAPEGRKELEYFVKSGIYPPVEAVFASPMLRCLQTAEVIYAGHTAVPVNDLKERCFGEFENLTHAEIIKRPGYEQWGMDALSMDFPGGECPDLFHQRCHAALKDVLDQCKQKGIRDAAVVVHGGVIMAILSVYGSPKRGYHDWMRRNGQGFLMQWDEQAEQLVYQRDIIKE